MMLGNRSKTPLSFRAEEVQIDSQLNLTILRTFVEGDCKRLHALQDLRCKQAGRHFFQSLVIHGGVGLGKTHCLHAVGNQVKSNLQ
jgi:chromosomal replication initiator protein